jgi:chromosomal replication initiator protein
MLSMNNEELWRATCGELSVAMTPAVYQSWIAQCFVIRSEELQDDIVLVELAAPSVFHQRHIEERYYGQIRKALENQVQKKVELSLTIKQKVKEEEPKELSGSLFTHENEIEEDKLNVGAEFGLNPRFTFDTLVVGSSNELAFAAAKAIVDNPGTRNNPLFIWGGVGVGKTHLMHAIGWALYEKGMRKIRVVSSEQFLSDLIASIRSRNTDQIRKKYREVDALMIDDIQFIAGKEATQEEFFHTFNDLYGRQKQIIMTSDRRPQDIKDVEQRLISRFLGGLLVDVGLPDYEMRLAILRQKADEANVIVEDQALNLIASNVSTNARELDGTFKGLISLSLIKGGVITSQMVENFLKLQPQKAPTKKLRAQEVISVVAKHFNIKNKDLVGHNRKADLVRARHLTMYLLREELGLQLQKIAELMGGRDHTTVMHGVEKVKREVTMSVDTREQIEMVRQTLYGV